MFAALLLAVELVTIEGKVLDAVTNQPLAGARVILLRTDKGPVMIGVTLWDTVPGEQDANADTLAALTDIDGAFRFRVEGPVKFRLFADYGGYVRWPQRMTAGETHEVKPGDKTAIVIRLTPEMSIAGRVTDDDTREPVKGLYVVPQQYRMGAARVLASVAKGSTTDESGRFKIESLTPGEYYLEVRPPYGEKIGEPKPVEDFTKAVQKTYARSWYPGVARAEEAVAVNLLPGANLEGVDFKIAKRRTAAVRGRILLADGASAPKEEILLTLFSIARRMGSASIGIIAEGKVKAGAGFEIGRLSPGTYWLDARTLGRSRADTLAAGMTLYIAEENQDGLDLVLRKGATVTGRIRMEGRDDQADQPALTSDGVRFNLSPLVRTLFLGEQGEGVPVRAADGSFTLEGVIAEVPRRGD